ncbi:phosducin-like protein, putative [Plasmodium gallinaceum]|uniref:Phosducin-like protein, putative n=1 Tax=Plasmodium gallinaceum TaxID=5849 RepID=A0A1J1H219_PLAGA|nr:phosducin-like protein, putative [Plasmodium gallinaceum]CRG97374.1 phosducin-like protein, putative [Plasmodium gallinaceum]
MITKNKLTNICTTLTLEKAKEDIEKECKIIKGNKPNSNYEQFNECLNEGKEVKNTVMLDENSDEEEIRKWREKRLMEFKKKKELKKEGVYIEISEKDFLPTVLKNYNVICHFYDNSFNRCEILHSHLIKLANIHLATKFIKVEAKNCLFFMKKLNINVLPSLCLFIDGVLIHTCIGFENFGNKDNFKTKDLERYLYKKKVISNMEYSESDEEI